MWTAPRLTGALRAFGNVSSGQGATHDVRLGKDLVERKALALQEQSKSCVSWKKISDVVRKNADAGKAEIDEALKQLSASAKAIAGVESSADTVESAAAYLFDIFKVTQCVGQTEARNLRNTFGPFPASHATKACQIVNKMVSWLPEKKLQELSASSDQRGDGDGAEMQEEFGAGIKFSITPWPQDEDLSSSDSEDDDDTVIKEISLCYSGKTISERKASREKESRVADGTDSVDSLWLQKQVKAYFSDNTGGLGLSPSELCTHIVDVLTSSRSDDELQNELFELLGFDRFEFIQLLLENRKTFVKNIALEATREAILQAPKVKKEEQRPVYGCQVTVQSAEERELQKQIRREEKRLNKKDGRKGDNGDLKAMAFDPEEMKIAREAALRNAKSKPLITGRTIQPQMREKFPFVFDHYEEARHSSAFVSGTKLVLPEGFERKDDKVFEEINIPPSEPAPTSIGQHRVPIDSLDEIARMAFKGTKSLNRIQSVVFDAAYHSNQNLLICAPTGAGKTNIAMLTILHEVKQHLAQGVIKKDEFKIVYVAPMKALAAEMVRNFGGRLEALGITVRELTGDMSLTKQEILKTQMLVTTPEKWDVVTRKSTGDVALAQLVRLLIIDEVHLLHDDRGPVIETLVARTIRQVESSQSMIRIVGLSATLPNYMDVARFLNVNPYEGLFFFDGRFRPVPLGQTFIGIKSLNKINQIRDMNQVCYDKVLKQVKSGYQVMVFVHARNETVRTAMQFRDFAKNFGQIGFFAPEQGPRYGEAEKNVMRSRNKQLKELFADGFAMHHAGMLRQDRNLVERYFAEGHIKVLCCTATLAWGVNLPAHAVIIKGTQIYDAKRGAFVDLGILDVMQIFGRAGRPQFDTFGHGTIITSHDKLSHYLSLMTRQNPIESQFVNSLTDNLNAEIALGTVTNVEEAVKWLSYTYLFVRMRLNPLVYGIPYNAMEHDPNLERHRYDLVVDAARKLDKAHMARFEERTGFLYSTDRGRIASHFYIKYDTVEVINEKFVVGAMLTEGDLFALVSRAQEFDQIKVRDDEMEELDTLTHNGCEMIVPGGKENTHGKVNILLQSYISRCSVDSFSLVSDMAYVAQNAGRIMRALFEMALRKGWPVMAGRLLEQCKTIDKRLWGFEHPLRQFPFLTPEILDKLERRRLTVDKLREMDTKEIGQMVSHARMGPVIKRCVHQLPSLELEANIQPITRTVLRVRLDIQPEFKWDDKVHGSTEAFWIWVEDPENNHIYHSEYYLMHKKQALSGEPQTVVFTIPIFEPLPTQYYVRAVSDRWIGSSSVCAISFQHLILPERHPPHTELLNLQPLPLTALNDFRLESLYSFTHFNPVQTQIFHTLYHNDCNVLLGAPTGSGKTIAAELAIFRVFREYPKFKAVYIAPLKALVRERMEDWKVRIEQKLGKKVVELTGDVTPDMRAVANADLIVTTPEKWDGVSRSWQTRSYVKAVALLVIDEIHLLGDERGPVLEVIVSRTNFISSHTSKKVRVVGLSTALANARDLADWLGIREMGLFNFRPSVRPVPLEVHIKGFPGQHYCPRMATMNKPAFQDIKSHSPDKPVLIFVSSRRQTRLTALDLIAYLAAEDNPKQWLHMPEAEVMLDEADRIMDSKFAKDMDHIISHLPENRQTLMFSATQTKSVKALARLSLKDPSYVSVHEHARHATPSGLEQSYIVCELHEKLSLLYSFLRNHPNNKIIVFMQTCKQVRYVHAVMKRERPGTSLLALYGGLNQLRRIDIYREYCRKQHVILFATDIACRGLDFPAVNWVVQLDCPVDVDTYIHRAGRTARLERNGQALLVLMPSEEQHMVDALERRKIPIKKISVNMKKMQDITGSVSAACASCKDTKDMADRAFRTYVYSLHKMKHSPVSKLDLPKFAQSLGLFLTPKLRFLKKKKPEAEVVEENEEEEEEISIEPLLLPKADTSLKGEKEPVAEEEEDEEEEDDDEARSRKKKPLTKAALARKLQKKNINLNTRVLFDEDGAPIKDKFKRQHEDDDDNDEGGLDVQAASKRLRLEDAVDKQIERARIKEKHREERIKKKEKKRAAQQQRRAANDDDDDEEEEEEGAILEGGEDDDPFQYIPDPDKLAARSRDESDDEEEDDRSDQKDDEDDSSDADDSEENDGSDDASDDDEDSDDDSDEDDDDGSQDHRRSLEDAAMQMLKSSRLKK